MIVNLNSMNENITSETIVDKLNSQTTALVKTHSNNSYNI